MGKKSIKENKNVYQLSREAQELTREKAGEQMEYVSADRIEKIESGKSVPHPDEILAMAKCYKDPALKNYYCSNECPIGQLSMPAIPKKELSQIVLEILASLNSMNEAKNRLVEISVDGKINPDEVEDFVAIREQLSKISASVAALQLWLEQTIADGKLDDSLL